MLKYTGTLRVMVTVTDTLFRHKFQLTEPLACQDYHCDTDLIPTCSENCKSYLRLCGSPTDGNRVRNHVPISGILPDSTLCEGEAWA
jgi:hypothetical protein